MLCGIGLEINFFIILYYFRCTVNSAISISQTKQNKAKNCTGLTYDGWRELTALGNLRLVCKFDVSPRGYVNPELLP